MWLNTWTRLPKKSAQRKILLNSRTLIRIKGIAHNLFHKICEDVHGECTGSVICAQADAPGGRDYTAGGRSVPLCNRLRHPGCAQVQSAQKLSLTINFDINQRLNVKMTRLLTSFSTVCVQNPVVGDGAQAACMGYGISPHAQKMGDRVFPLKINCLIATFCSCAQFCPQKMCRRVETSYLL